MKRETKLALAAILVVVPISLYAVWDTGQVQGLSDVDKQDKVQVVTSFFPLFDFAREVGGDKVEVSILVPPGVEPHDWEPSIKELQKLQNADLILINGLGFETWVDDLDSLNESDLKIVDTSKGIKGLLDSGEDHHHEHNEDYDPHVWLNPKMAQSQVTNIVKALSEVDPKNKDFYQNNGETYIQKLDSLDKKIRSELQGCKKDFISFHSAFSYFSREYGLNQHTILESTDSNVEPTSKKIERVVLLARELGIKTIFSEDAVDTRTPHVVAVEIGGNIMTLSTLERANYDSRYIEKMENNLSNLKEALC